MVRPQLIALAVLASAGYLLYDGGRELRSAYHVLRNDPMPIQDLHDCSGPVKIESTALADDEAVTVPAPFSGTECLAYTYEAEELRLSGDTSSWHTLDEGTDGVDFLVGDETGRVLVDPTGADVRLADRALRVSPGEELPERIAAYVEATDDVDEAAAIGVPHGRWPDRPVALAVPAGGVDRDALTGEVESLLEGTHPSWWVPDTIEYLEEIPKTATWKFSKRDLREEYADESLVEGRVPEDAAPDRE